MERWVKGVGYNHRITRPNFQLTKEDLDLFHIAEMLHDFSSGEQRMASIYG